MTDPIDNPAAANSAESEPRQIAVALKHDRASDRVPKIVATGRGALAERILELAFASGIKVREDADLAEVLAAIEADEDIPVAAFAAVAEILSYVYRANLEDTGAEPVNSDNNDDRKAP